MRRTGETKQNDRYNLSPKQATAIRQLHRAAMPIAEAQHVLQTTLGALYRRGYIKIRDGYFMTTEAGDEALRQQTHADIHRSRGMYDAPFAGVIAELAGYKRKEPGRAGKLRMIPRRKAA
jgi:hypothetical protein